VLVVVFASQPGVLIALSQLFPGSRSLHSMQMTGSMMSRARLLPLLQFDELVFACGAEQAKRMLGQGATR
jgi:hypothetical protein